MKVHNEKIVNDLFNHVQTNKTSPDLEANIRNYIAQKFSNYYHNNITQHKKAKIEHMSKDFSELQDIGIQKDKHQLKWAFLKLDMLSLMLKNVNSLQMRIG